MFLKNFFYFLFNSIYKKSCCVCNNQQGENFLCKTCAKLLNYLPSYPHTKIEGVDVYSCFNYEEQIKTLIHSYKFFHKRDLCVHFGSFLYKYFVSILKEEKYIIVYVPSHKNRLKKRGFNHIKLIAEEFSKLSNIPVAENVLIKTKETIPQYELKYNERKENIKGSFGINFPDYKGEKIIIIDDIITTGSTLSEIIKEFKKNKIENLVCLTLCKTKI